MGKLKSLLTGTLLGAGGMYVGLQYHLLQAEEGFLIVPRLPQQRLQDSYADVRDWDATAWTARPQLSLAVTQHGRSDLITDGVTTNLLDSLRESVSPVPQQLEQSSQGWEPTTTTRVPSSDKSRTGKEALPRDNAPRRKGFLPLAELFGIDGQTRPAKDARTVSPDDRSVTPVLPAGVTNPKQVEILPSPGEFEMLRDPEDVNLGPSAPIPGSKHSMDRRRSDAAGSWQPLTVQPF